MKNKTYKNILGFFLASMVLFASCEKEDPIKLDAQMATWNITDITSTSAVLSGLVVAEGAGYTEYGICWNATGAPSVDDNIATPDTIDKAVFKAEVTGLSHLTTYYVAAFVKTADGTVTYGDDTTFTTLANIAAVSVDAVTAITDISATSGGNVTDNGKAAVTAKGVCWSMETEPTIDDENDFFTEDGDGVGAYTSNLVGLIGGIKYYVRAYATNEIGIAYSNEVTFTTDNGFAVVTTDSVQDVTKTTAKAYGHALYTGGTAITERGFVWATTTDPTILDNSIQSGSDTGKFEADLIGLTAGTTYYIRAYTTNSQGTSYGDNISISTIGEFFIVGSLNGWDNTGQYMEYLGNSMFVGYQYLTSTDEFKFFPVSGSWSNGWGDAAGNCGSDGSAALNGGNICTSTQSDFTVDGFYEIKLDAANETVALTLITTIGVIGDAQSGEWTTDVDLTYNIGTKVWEGQVTFLATGAYKFRSNNDWDPNPSWGGALIDLTVGGENINTPGAGTYDVVLDLSGQSNFNATVTAAK